MPIDFQAKREKNFPHCKVVTETRPRGGFFVSAGRDGRRLAFKADSAEFDSPVPLHLLPRCPKTDSREGALCTASGAANYSHALSPRRSDPDQWIAGGASALRNPAIAARHPHYGCSSGQTS